MDINKKNQRELNIDLLRIFACIMVVFLHASGNFWAHIDIHSIEWSVVNFYEYSVRSCVPLFLMISGRLFLSKKSDVNIKDFFKRHVLKIFVLYLFWSLFYSVYNIYRVSSELNFMTIMQGIYQSEFHLWYLPVLISIYLLYPLFKIIVDYKDGDYLKYCCIIFILFGVIQITLLDLSLPIRITRFNLFNDFVSDIFIYSGYFIWGYTLYKYQDKFKLLKKSYLFILFLCFVGFSSYIGMMDSYSRNEVSKILMNNKSLFPFLEATVLFLFFTKNSLNIKNEKNSKFIIKLSKYTLFIYLIHPFFLDILVNIMKGYGFLLSPVIMIPMLTIMVVFLSICFAFIVEKIPFIHKWIM